MRVRLPLKSWPTIGGFPRPIYRRKRQTPRSGRAPTVSLHLVGSQYSNRHIRRWSELPQRHHCQFPIPLSSDYKTHARSARSQTRSIIRFCRITAQVPEAFWRWDYHMNKEMKLERAVLTSKKCFSFVKQTSMTDVPCSSRDLTRCLEYVAIPNEPLRMPRHNWQNDHHLAGMLSSSLIQKKLNESNRGDASDPRSTRRRDMVFCDSNLN